MKLAIDIQAEAGDFINGTLDVVSLSDFRSGMISRFLVTFAAYTVPGRVRALMPLLGFDRVKTLLRSLGVEATVMAKVERDLGTMGHSENVNVPIPRSGFETRLKSVAP